MCVCEGGREEGRRKREREREREREAGGGGGGGGGRKKKERNIHTCKSRDLLHSSDKQLMCK